MVGRFAGMWLLVSLAAVAVASVSSYLALQTREGGAGGLWGALLVVTALTVGGVAALAVFTTHRLAGPWIAVRRALEGVRDGDLQTSLRFRSVDPHLREIERVFNEMTDALRRGRSDAA